MNDSEPAIIEAKTEPSHAPEAQEWSLAARFAFRWGVCYFILCLYPDFPGFRDGHYDPNNIVWKMWDQLVPWVGSHLLNIATPVTAVIKEGGDQPYDYIQWLCVFIIALIAATIWSFLDRKRKQYDGLYEWLRVFVRLTLAFVMIDYGIGKLFPAQFPNLSLATLVDTYGRSSPTDLLWNSMRYSKPYSFFGGVGETLGAILLIVPGLTTLGALITLAMVSNVLMLNLSYDVPRKIFCIHLLAMCLFLLWPDLRRLFGFFVLHRSEQLPPPPPLFRDKALAKAATFLQLGVGVLIIISFVRGSYQTAVHRNLQIGPPLRGIWNVDQFNIDGALRSPLVTDTGRWRRVILDSPIMFTVQSMDGAQQQFNVQWNEEKTKGSLWDLKDRSLKGSIAVQNVGADHMSLEALVAGHHIKTELQRVDLSDPSEFRLTNHGFHWIN